MYVSVSVVLFLVILLFASSREVAEEGGEGRAGKVEVSDAGAQHGEPGGCISEIRDGAFVGDAEGGWLQESYGLSQPMGNA